MFDVLLSLGSIIIGIIGTYLTIKFRTQKAFAYDILSTSPIVVVGKEVKGEIKITYKGKPINEMYLTEITIYNNGNTPIRKDDFESDIEIIFHAKTELYSANVLMNPSITNWGFALGENHIQISPVSFNQGETINIKAFTSKMASSPEVRTRIIGISQITKNPRLIKINSNFLMLVGIIGNGLIVLPLVYMIPIDALSKYVLSGFIVVLLFFIEIAIFFKILAKKMKLRFR